MRQPSHTMGHGPSHGPELSVCPPCQQPGVLTDSFPPLHCCLSYCTALHCTALLFDFVPASSLSSHCSCHPPQCLRAANPAACMAAVAGGMQAWEYINNCPANVNPDYCLACLKGVPGQSWMCGNCARRQQGIDACFQCVATTKDAGCTTRSF